MLRPTSPALLDFCRYDPGRLAVVCGCAGLRVVVLASCLCQGWVCPFVRLCFQWLGWVGCRSVGLPLGGCAFTTFGHAPPLSPSPGSGAFLMSGTTQGCLFGRPGGRTALTRAGVGSAWRCGTWLWAWRAKLPRLEPGGGEVYFMRGLVSKQLRKQRKASVRLAEQRAG